MGPIADAVDIHVHAGPSFFDRKYDAIELAKEYADSEMDGFVLKSHFGNSHKSATMAAARVDDIDIYSSVTLNSFVGGFNPTAVEHGLETGARIVWLPTFSAANFEASGIGREFPFSNQRLSALDDDGELRPAVRDVLEVLGNHDDHVVLGNGHLSREESFAVLDAMEEMGIDVPYLVTHADFEFMGLSFEDQHELVSRGGIVEKCYLPVLHGDVTLNDVVASIEDLGADRCVLSTDHGQSSNESPPEAYASYAERVLEAGLDESALRMVTTETPRKLLGTA